MSQLLGDHIYKHQLALEQRATVIASFEATCCKTETARHWQLGLPRTTVSSFLRTATRIGNTKVQ